ncbi:hypothetical protein GQ600_18944 [Phytophthora cactorum]|nr:hypothetical protein GQ600_18944 [Phytophthora cactorum]
MVEENSDDNRRYQHTPTDTEKRRRITRSAGGDDESTATPSCLGGDVMFKQAWPSLRKAGWAFNPPSVRSLDSHYIFVRPGEVKKEKKEWTSLSANMRFYATSVARAISRRLQTLRTRDYE